MDDCPITFATSHPLLPRLIPTGGDWTYGDPNLGITIDFAEDMDQTAEPPMAFWKIDVDGVNKTPDSGAWVDARQYGLAYAEAVLGPTDIRLHWQTKHPDLLSVLDELVTPFNILLTAP